ncbi:hypothetical protein [Neptunomonas phycophila]|uniref:hypothetical protein n=1 Tax=Neptunomonas phycophila TaxID=1572645 RepID=UPI0023FA0AF8|nr:hypothetical protein [Neptunomonas phycophila]
MRCVPFLLVSLLSFPVATMAASYKGAESVPLFHPLCFEPLMAQEDDGGAYDMAACAEEFKDIPVKRTPDGGLYAKRPAREDESALTAGYVVYEPIGTLDEALELVLYHDKQPEKAIHARVLVMARLPGFSPLYREYITSIDEAGTRCNGSIQGARLISEAILEVDLNVNSATLMKLAAPELPLGKAGQASDDIASLSLKPKDQLDNNESHCIGTVTKTYNLIDSREALKNLSFITGLKPTAANPYQACFDGLLDEFIKPPGTLDLQEFDLFKQLFVTTCGIK